MSKFKVGDRVRRIHGDHKRMKVEDTDIVTSGSSNFCITLEEYGSGHDPANFELVISKHHKHHALIIQWAKGAEIEFYSESEEEWTTISRPQWAECTKYRLKPPVPKSDKERISELEARVEELENQC